jgi:uridine kinase
MFFVFIGGQSASGKTGVSQHLKIELNALGINTQILKMDDYYFEFPDNEHLNFEQWRLETNFDTPKMLDFDLFKTHILDLNQGKSITKFLFNFSTNRRQGTEQINPSDVLIIEGIFGQYFYNTYLPLDLPALSINVATESYNDIVKRRIIRDFNDRSRKKEDVILQERKFVGPGFFKYTAPHAHADIYINNVTKNTREEQDVLLQQAAIEICKEVTSKMAQAASGILQSRKPSPNALRIIEQSHRDMQDLGPRSYHGVFGTL